MAKIPGAESTRTLNTPTAPQATGEGLRRDEAAQKSLGGAISESADVLMKIQDTQEMNAASIYANEQLMALKEKSDMDPDFKAGNKYAVEAEKIGADAAKNITGDNARNAFIAQYKTSSLTTLSGIHNTFRARQLDAAKADFLTNVATLQESYFNATYPQEKATAAALIKQSIADNIAGLIISETDGVKLWEQIKVDLPSKDAERDIGKNPAIALQRLQANTYGITDEGKRAELIADAERAAIREKKMEQLGFQKAQEQIAIDLTSKLWDGSLTIAEVHNEMITGALDRKDAEILRKAILSDKTSDVQSLTKEQKTTTETQQAITYMAMWGKILKKGKATDKRRELLKEFADGNLNKTDAVKLYTGYLIPAQGGGKTSLAEEVAAEEAASHRNGFISGAIQTFRKFWNQATPIEEGDAE